MGLMDAGASMLNAAAKKAAGVSITYTPKTGTPVVLTAVVGGTPFRTNDYSGASVIERTRDFTFEAADFHAANPGAEPENGDVVEQVIGGIERRFKLYAPNSEPSFRYSDAGRTRIRVHTIEVSNAA